MTHPIKIPSIAPKMREKRRKAPSVKGTRGLTCAREGIRTPNLLIRSQMLYPLSYARLFTSTFTADTNNTFLLERAQIE